MRWQAIIETNDGPIHWRIYQSSSSMCLNQHVILNSVQSSRHHWYHELGWSFFFSRHQHIVVQCCKQRGPVFHIMSTNSHQARDPNNHPFHLQRTTFRQYVSWMNYGIIWCDIWKYIHRFHTFIKFPKIKCNIAARRKTMYLDVKHILHTGSRVTGIWCYVSFLNTNECNLLT